MSKTIRIEVDTPKIRNPLAINGQRGSGRQVFRDRRDRRIKDFRNSWKNDQER
jgi:hypothetical protein